MCAAELPALKYVELTPEWLDQIQPIERVSFPIPWSIELQRSEFAKEISFILGLVNGGELLAYSFNHFFVGELHILSLAVQKDQRRLGYGAALLGMILEEAKSGGGKIALLEVRRSNTTAHALYQRFGFEQTFVRKAYYRDNHEDALVFQLHL